MSGTILVFGATGYTGNLVVEALLERGERPVLVGRSREKLKRQSQQLGDLEYRIADVNQPDSVKDVVSPGDILVSTVGPFIRFGEPALEAALSQGAHYLDSTGEPAFIRHVFEQYGLMAQEKQLGFLTSFGYDYVPGSLAAGLALEQAGPSATRVDIGYFVEGGGGFGMSQGTAASLAGAMVDPGLFWRGHQLREGYGGTDLRHFKLAGKSRPAISLPATEHIVLPRSYPELDDVNAYLGWFGLLSYPMVGFSRVQEQLLKLSPYKKLLKKAAAKAKSDGTGPNAEERAQSGSHVIAQAYDRQGRELARADLTGVNGYTYTGKILAWAAQRIRQGELKQYGALGPIEAFGVSALKQGNIESGMEPVS